MANLNVGSDGQVNDQRSQISRTFDSDNSSQLISLPDTETKMSLLANLFMSEGKAGLAFICMQSCALKEALQLDRIKMTENHFVR